MTAVNEHATEDSRSEVMCGASKGKKMDFLLILVECFHTERQIKQIRETNT